jgi:hypothetical protein
VYDPELWDRVHRKTIRVVQSSNVYSYAWESDGSESGTLYVTYLHWAPGMKASERSGPGATYSYGNFPRERYLQFQAASNESAGAAVWDFCRQRGTQHGHQHPVALVSVAGQYVPRKATANGFKRRTMVRAGMPLAKRKLYAQMAKLTQGVASLNELSDDQLPTGFQRSTLQSQSYAPNRGEPDRGGPNRGRPNRGRPNRGR